MKQINLHPLKDNRFVLVDEDVFDELNKYHWSVTPMGYPYREEWDKMKRKKFTMHREIMKAKKGETVDHVNGDTLDNRKENLRFCTQMENCRNQVIKSNNKTGYKGVSWDKKYQKYSSFLTVNYKHIFGGYFEKKEDAAIAYNKLALKYHGEFARLNTI